MVSFQRTGYKPGAGSCQEIQIGQVNDLFHGCSSTGNIHVEILQLSDVSPKKFCIVFSKEHAREFLHEPRFHHVTIVQQPEETTYA